MITRPKTSPIHRREKPVAVKNKRSAKKIMKSKQDEKLSRKRINPIGVRSKKKPNLDLILSSLSYFLTDMEHRQRANPPSSRRDQGGGGEEGCALSNYVAVSWRERGGVEVAHVVVSFHPAGTGCRRAVN